MAVLIDQISIRGLRATHFEQLMSYIQQAEDDGWHYGNRDQFSKRHNEIKELVGRTARLLRSEGVKTK